VLLAAGTDTTASTVSAITYHLLANPKILQRLKVELEEAMPNPETMPTSLKVEALPYLTAVIQEGIRLHPGASIRQERVAPDEDLFYQDRKSGKKYMIPKGVRSNLFHKIPEIFF
jgi:cytochrome P450